MWSKVKLIRIFDDRVEASPIPRKDETRPFVVVAYEQDFHGEIVPKLRGRYGTLSQAEERLMKIEVES
jgi:hypothetical protein